MVLKIPLFLIMRSTTSTRFFQRPFLVACLLTAGIWGCGSPEDPDRSFFQILAEDEHFVDGSLSFQKSQGKVTGIDLEGYSGETLPQEIATLSGLKGLKLINCKVREISIVRRFPLLWSLSIYNSALEEIPDLSSLTNLWGVSFSGTNLSDTIDGKWFPSQLRQLTVNRSDITHITHLQNLSALEDLSLAYNNLGVLSIPVCRLDSLNRLTISGNPLWVDPASEELECLKSFASQNELTADSVVWDKLGLEP
ncbi:hypothetical protein [Pontibacter sp. G13]|uniref:leucine-rich repeat domain-containing protein n=1 Tax=Pontibacter sp. G13 TaxID=3074898 RepID=UPI00288BB20D|nr:hypothetical protein [Pontibacter sp. G13]WNJ18807.1 hypothetical protein RJD25_28455 [Pontibacter sp. G13]